LLPTAALTGGLIVLAADTVGRNLFAPTQIPAGIFTAIIGVPYFLYLLYRHRNEW
jgi:iron complex transport system permease protein